MGFAVDDCVDMGGPHFEQANREIAHHQWWGTPDPFALWKEYVARNGPVAALARHQEALWRRAVGHVPAGGAALVISHGGLIEPGLIVCLPNSDHSAWAAAADTNSDLDAARQRYAEAQAAANQVASDLNAEEGRAAELTDGIAALQRRITTTRKHERQLVAVVRLRAALAYTHASTSHLSVVLDASNPLEAARRAHLVDIANQKDNLAVQRLAALRSDLHDQQASLREQRDEVKQQHAELTVKSAEIQTRLVAAANARDELIKELEAQQAAAAEEAAAQAKAQQLAVAAELDHLRLAQAAAPPPVQATAHQAPASPVAPAPVGGWSRSDRV
jgi:hypothetical protein